MGKERRVTPTSPLAPGPGSLAPRALGLGQSTCKDPLPEGGSQMDCLPRLITNTSMVGSGVQRPVPTPVPQRRLGSLPNHLPTQPEADSQ